MSIIQEYKSAYYNLLSYVKNQGEIIIGDMQLASGWLARLNPLTIFTYFRLAILPVGSYEKRWFMKNQHINPDDAVRVHKMLKVAQSVGIHFGTFAEHPEQTINAHEKDLKVALEKYNISESEFWILKFGEGREIR